MGCRVSVCVCVCVCVCVWERERTDMTKGSLQSTHFQKLKWPPFLWWSAAKVYNPSCSKSGLLIIWSTCFFTSTHDLCSINQDVRFVRLTLAGGTLIAVCWRVYFSCDVVSCSTCSLDSISVMHPVAAACIYMLIFSSSCGDFTFSWSVKVHLSGPSCETFRPVSWIQQNVSSSHTFIGLSWGARSIAWVNTYAACTFSFGATGTRSRSLWTGNTVPLFESVWGDCICREIMSLRLAWSPIQRRWQAKPSLITLLGCSSLMCIWLHVCAVPLWLCRNQFGGFRSVVFMSQYSNILL